MVQKIKSHIVVDIYTHAPLSFISVCIIDTYIIISNECRKLKYCHQNICTFNLLELRFLKLKNVKQECLMFRQGRTVAPFGPWHSTNFREFVSSKPKFCVLSSLELRAMYVHDKRCYLNFRNYFDTTTNNYRYWFPDPINAYELLIWNW